MGSRLALVLGVPVLACLYLVANTYAIGVAAAIPAFTWSSGTYLNRATATLFWLHTFHALAIALVAVPFSYVISRAYGRWGPLLALATTAGICAAIVLPTLVPYFQSAGTFLRALFTLDTLEQLAILPGFVLLARRLSSNYRLERP